MPENTPAGFVDKYHPVYERAANSMVFRNYLRYIYHSSLSLLNEKGWNSFTKDNPKVLLCGAGSSTTANEYAHFVAKNTKSASLNILDFSDYPLKKSKEKLAESQVDHNNLTINFIRANALQIPLADNSIDHIETDCFIQFFTLEQRENLVKEWMRVLKPGGTITTREFIKRDTPISKLLHHINGKLFARILGVQMQGMTASSLENLFKNDQLESQISAAKIPFTGLHYPAFRFITARKKELTNSSEIRFPINQLSSLHENRKLSKVWGWDNIKWHVDNKCLNFMRVIFPHGLAGPMHDWRRLGLRSGAGFLTSNGVSSADHYKLSYKIRFPNGFDFVRGGKLPGLYGGTAPTGGEKANGINGFTSRIMWRENGNGEVYLYAPQESNNDPSIKYDRKWGMSLGRGNWQFRADDQWHTIEQEVYLNTPGKNDGRVSILYDGLPVFNNLNIVFRHDDSLKIDGLCFSTFFGGNDISWASPKETHVDFADFIMSE